MMLRAQRPTFRLAQKKKNDSFPLLRSNILTHAIVTEIITKLIRWEFSPVMFLSKITELIVGEFSSGN